jgi:hypothetical protein
MKLNPPRMVSRVLKLSESVIPDGLRSPLENGIDGVRKGSPEMVRQRQCIAVELVRPKRKFMSPQHSASASPSRKSQAGVLLLECMISLSILLVVVGSLMGLATIATSTTETQGHLAARTTEYAQDKMEQLLAL